MDASRARTRAGRSWAAASAFAVALVALPARAESPLVRGSLFDRPMDRSGFHFLVMFGWGGGSTSNGLLHSMELGGTFPESGITLAYDHVWIWSDGLLEPEGGSDLFGGHLLVARLPMGVPELDAKIGIGLGENVELSDGFVPHFGLGWTYGIDLHLPAFADSGPTIGLLGVHAHTVDRGHQAGWGAGLGYTLF